MHDYTKWPIDKLHFHISIITYSTGTYQSLWLYKRIRRMHIVCTDIFIYLPLILELKTALKLVMQLNTPDINDMILICHTKHTICICTF